MCPEQLSKLDHFAQDLDFRRSAAHIFAEGAASQAHHGDDPRSNGKLCKMCTWTPVQVHLRNLPEVLLRSQSYHFRQDSILLLRCSYQAEGKLFH
jgi:hypothetical protein